MHRDPALYVNPSLESTLWCLDVSCLLPSLKNPDMKIPYSPALTFAQARAGAKTW